MEVVIDLDTLVDRFIEPSLWVGARSEVFRSVARYGEDLLLFVKWLILCLLV